MTRVRYEDNVCCCVPDCAAPRTMMYPHGKRRSRYCAAHLEANRATYNQSGRKGYQQQPVEAFDVVLKRAQALVKVELVNASIPDQKQPVAQLSRSLKYEAVKCTKWRKEVDALVEQIERQRSEKGAV